MNREQIREMAKCCTYYHNGECCADATHISDCDLMCEMFGTFANLEKADYRKQSEGEWETICHLRTDVFNAYSHICSKCKYFYKDFRPVGYTYCPHCGAKMEGGE